MALGAATGLGSGARADLGPDLIAEFLSATSLFRECDGGVIRKVAPHLMALDFRAGSVIVRAGAPEPVLGILFAGHAVVRLVNAASGQATVQDHLRVGDFFGEVGSVLNTAQPTEVFAEDECTVLFIGKDVVQQLSSKVAGFSAALARRLAAKVVKAGITALRPGAASTVPIAPAPTDGAAAAGDARDPNVIEFVRVSAYDPGPKVLQLIPPRLIQRHRLLPLEVRGRTLVVGMVDPHNAAAISELRRMLSAVDPEIVAISLDDFNETFVRAKIDSATGARSNPNDMIQPETLVFDGADSEREADKAVRVIGDEVINLANKVIATGIERGASDIHLEADASSLRVRYRISGTLIDWDQYVPQSFAKGLAARFKVLSGLDITERRLPQDGRIGVKVGRREIDLRVSTLPASRGEKIVMRIFEAANMMRPLEHIFMEQNTLGAVRDSLNRPFGAIVVAGPTGSGKSSTLYAALNERRKTRPDTNIIMVEDPIEYRLQGVTQVQVNHQIDLDFAKVLRAMLRQDPDVIMVGEVRDQETAELALEAAMTGHLLFTSLHANNAIGVVQRLENLGCNRTMISQSLALVIIQRLARRLCKRCSTNEVPPPALLESLAGKGLVDASAPVPLPHAVGCADCNQTGFSGRIAVIESMQFSDAIRNELMAGTPLGEIEKLAEERGDLIPFRRYASFMMTRGLIGPSEALLTIA